MLSPSSLPIATQAYRKALGRAAHAFSGTWKGNYELRRWVRKQATVLRHLIAAIERAPTRDKQKRAIYRLLKSGSAKICALILAANEGQFTQASIVKMARAINPWEDCGEPVWLKKLMKANGSERVMGAFGTKRSALQRLCALALSSAWGVSNLEYNTKGRGGIAAVTSAMSSMNSFNEWVLLVDVQDCYPSVGQDGLAAYLPLPEKVIRSSVLIPDECVILASNGSYVSSSDREQLRQGIPQGSPASQIIASRLISEAVAEVAHDHHCFHYSDNVFAALSSESQAKATFDTLTERFGALPVGALTLHTHALADATKESVRFLGYKLRLLTKKDEWKAVARPAARATKRFDDFLHEELVLAEPDQREDMVIELTSAWIAEDPIWDPPTTIIESEINERLAWLPGISAKEEVIFGALGLASGKAI